MKGAYKVICLCGSTRFKDMFMAVQKTLTLNGCIVISVGCFGHAGDKFTDEQKVMLDDMHKSKIDMSDAICVIDTDGDCESYIGNSTKSEIAYAEATGKQVCYISKDELEVIVDIDKDVQANQHCDYCLWKANSINCTYCKHTPQGKHSNFNWSCVFCKHDTISGCDTKADYFDNDDNQCTKFELDNDKLQKHSIKQHTI